MGTTNFDALIEKLNADAHAFLTYFTTHNYTHLTLQIGKTGHVRPIAFQHAAAADYKQLALEVFELVPNIVPYIQQAALVISHAGAGSILEALHAHRPLLIVTNSSLMHNHQVELARILTNGQYLYAATPDTLLSVLQQGDFREPEPTMCQPVGMQARYDEERHASVQEPYRLRRYPTAQPALFPQFLDKHMQYIMQHTQPASASYTLSTIILPALLAALLVYLIMQRLQWA